MTDWAPRREAFRALHSDGCFVLPNPWDTGSARRLQALGFKALASSSSAAALSLGVSDYELTLDQCLDHLEILCAATDLPVNADFENGFADAPEDVAANVTRAIATGIAGLSIEDQHGDSALRNLRTYADEWGQLWPRHSIAEPIRPRLRATQRAYHDD